MSILLKNENDMDELRNGVADEEQKTARQIKEYEQLRKQLSDDIANIRTEMQLSMTLAQQVKHSELEGQAQDE